jgi:hypothetical protein
MDITLINDIIKILEPFELLFDIAYMEFWVEVAFDKLI